MGVNASALTRGAKLLGVRHMRRLYGIVDSLGGTKGRIVLISSNTVNVNINGLSLARGPASVPAGRTTTTINRYRLVCACSGLFSRCGRAITRVLLANRSINSSIHHAGFRGAVSHLLRLNTLPVVGRGSSVSATRVRVNSGSALNTVITATVGTSLLVVLSSVSKLCATSPRGGNGTDLIGIIRGVSRDVSTVVNNINDGLNANNVTAGVGTTELIAGRKVSVIVTGNTYPRGLCNVMRNGDVKAHFVKRGL